MCRDRESIGPEGVLGSQPLPHLAAVGIDSDPLGIELARDQKRLEEGLQDDRPSRSLHCKVKAGLLAKAPMHPLHRITPPLLDIRKDAALRPEGENISPGVNRHEINPGGLGGEGPMPDIPRVVEFASHACRDGQNAHPRLAGSNVIRQVELESKSRLQQGRVLEHLHRFGTVELCASSGHDLFVHEGHDRGHQ